MDRETSKRAPYETNLLGFNNTSNSVLWDAGYVSDESMDIFDLITKVGAPIAAAVVMGGFIFLIMKQIMDGTKSNINSHIIHIESVLNLSSHRIKSRG